MKRWVRSLLILGCCSSVFADRPFVTQEAETLAQGLLSFDVGLRYRDEPRDFGVADRDEQLELVSAQLAFGIGRIAELQITGTALMLIDQNGENETNAGDWVLGTKIWFVDEKKRRPSVSFLYEVKLPNASDERGGSTDETDVFGWLLLTNQVGRNDVLHGNIGLGILGVPDSNGSQNDVGILRLAWERRLGDKQLFGLETLLQRGPKDDDDPRVLRAGYARQIGRWALTAGVSAGLSDDADDLAVDLGFRRRFQLRAAPEGTRRNDW